MKLDSVNRNTTSGKSLPVFKKSLSCITPIKSAPPKELKSVTFDNTPPNFWSLDMPPSPTI